MEEMLDVSFENLDEAMPQEVEKPVVEEPKKEKEVKGRRKKVERIEEEESPLINCLRNEKVIVRFVPKETGNVTDPKHILYGGMAETAVRNYSVPTLESGVFVNVLTNAEKDYLESIMGLEYNALSIYKKEDNYWENRLVRLTKGDNIFDLSNPEEYIKLKILLANKDDIAPSLAELQNRPKATYKFVVIQGDEEVQTARKEMSVTMECYMEYGKVSENFDVLRFIVETFDSRPISKNTKIEALQSKINKLIQANSKLFLKIIKDPLLNAKVLLKRAIEANIVSNRGGYLYLRDDGSALSARGEDPTLEAAAQYISSPKNQQLKFSLEAKLKQ